MTNRRHDILILILLVLTSGMAQPLAAAELPTLNSMESRSELGITRLVLDFDKLPTYSLKTSGQRIDLRLNDSQTGPGIKRLPEDDKVIKVLVARDKEGVIISFLLRRLPSHVLATPDAHLHQLKISIRWEDDDRVRPGIVFDLPDMPAVRKTGAELKRTALPLSPYRGNWLAFLKKSHTPIKCDVSPTYTFPTLPHPEFLDKEPEESKEVWLKLWAESDWQGLDEATRTSESEAARLLNLEAQLRLGRQSAILSELQILKRGLQNQDLLLRLRYLLAHAQASENKTFEAILNLTEIVATPGTPQQLKDAALLFQSELELALGHPVKALKALNKMAEVQDPDLVLMRDLRQVDQLAIAGAHRKALKGYKALPIDLIDQHPFSLALMAYSNQIESQHGKARECFSLLAQKPLSEQNRALARFGELTCYADPQDILVYFDELQKIRWDDPKAEVSYRIVMKLTDMMAPAENGAAIRRQLTDYRMVSQEANLINLRLEAAVKVAALQHLLGDDPAAVAQLETTLRNFSGGELRADAIALLGEILPSTIEKMIASGRNIDALVLVERNRDLLIQQPLTWDFLYDVAVAFDRLDLDERADKIYLYLYDRADTKQRKAQACLLLANNYLQLEEFTLAREYSDRYRHFDPAGADYARAITCGLKARVALQGPEQGLKWLTTVTQPEDPSLNLYIAELNWGLGNYPQVIRNLKTFRTLTGDLPQQAALKEAEAYYRTGQHETALPLYRELFTVEQLGDQARYRAASIMLQGGEQLAGAQLLKEVADKENPNLWSRLAADSLRGLTL